MKKKLCVIGLGNFGFYMTQQLFELGHDVIAIDNDKEKIQAIKEYCSYALLDDAANKEFLTDQGITEMDAVVVAMGEHSHLATLVTLFLKELEVPKIVVKAVSEEHGRILAKVGATEIIYPEKDMAKRLAHNLSSHNILDFIPLSEKFSLSETIPPKSFVGKTIIDLDIRNKFHVSVIAIKNDTKDEFILAPLAKYTIEANDKLILLGQTEDVNRIINQA
ncbi:MAG: TrkA family potassium uptake protein [Synergistales bacterium]|nr:TrkA family potassium uptake protein [Synergistales bacterium]